MTKGTRLVAVDTTPVHLSKNEHLPGQHHVELCVGVGSAFLSLNLPHETDLLQPITHHAGEDKAHE
jgi:hypothetical protein